MDPISRGYRLTLVSLVLAGTVGCDQASKQLASSHLRDEPAQSFLGGTLVNDGHVVDFMVLGIGPVRTGVFNVADIAIMFGIGLMFLGVRRGSPRGEHQG
jgi:hypothetical protein